MIDDLWERLLLEMKELPISGTPFEDSIYKALETAYDRGYDRGDEHGRESELSYYYDTRR